MKFKIDVTLWLKRMIILLSMPALMMFQFSSPVYATDVDGYQLHGHKLTGGISTVYYGWYNPHGYTPGTGSGYDSLIMNAQNDWESALAQTTQTNFQSTSYASTNCTIIFIMNNTPVDNTFAGCRFFTASGNPLGDSEHFGAPIADYTYCYVICYHQNLSDLTSNSQVKAVFAHETGMFSVWIMCRRSVGGQLWRIPSGTPAFQRLRQTT